MSESSQIVAYIGLGSNLESPRQQVSRALDELGDLPETHCTARSLLYRTPPMGPPDQPDYINAVAAVTTSLSAEMLLEELQRLERLHWRVRNGERWGPRTLDLDLLLFGHQQIKTSRLIVPHPGLGERAFVLYPLAEIAPPGLDIPLLGSLSGLLERISGDGIEKVV
ncbi:MAG: 2-amino-4-hydroxy-6-hydroxymethyldihydropteridine diphosphokinase [gamma proteobacterium endosymbiont of Lamellibrachia anaximandri]|nr:2-amino-4-hydroxy-6-hydroxymethyldihydropteridine diphosphokinase [gamma proteobacterium endosymbiont of Lamellibrachia anaximandri]MBL3532949.1 2-amino-4-hydroxy-6-hydroxymethyldihydropteridine diphosphokinase [gamma proteobacterium endosymbiont of Lamellibrachia anaximandri]MBL3601194.1 2-amino-4-hydroxy-6-hydroxymethyldihydropteridine diphosphokinase [gamma proteobacterium endosymbiont of Lamellibrachia anaximandri]